MVAESGRCPPHIHPLRLHSENSKSKLLLAHIAASLAARWDEVSQVLLIVSAQNPSSGLSPYQKCFLFTPVLLVRRQVWCGWWGSICEYAALGNAPGMKMCSREKQRWSLSQGTSTASLDYSHRDCCVRENRTPFLCKPLSSQNGDVRKPIIVFGFYSYNSIIVFAAMMYLLLCVLLQNISFFLNC